MRSGTSIIGRYFVSVNLDPQWGVRQTAQGPLHVLPESPEPAPPQDTPAVEADDPAPPEQEPASAAHEAAPAPVDQQPCVLTPSAKWLLW